MNREKLQRKVEEQETADSKDMFRRSAVSEVSKRDSALTRRALRVNANIIGHPESSAAVQTPPTIILGTCKNTRYTHNAAQIWKEKTIVRYGNDHYGPWDIMAKVIFYGLTEPAAEEIKSNPLVRLSFDQYSQICEEQTLTATQIHELQLSTWKTLGKNISLTGKATTQLNTFEEGLGWIETSAVDSVLNPGLVELVKQRQSEPLQPV